MQLQAKWENYSEKIPSMIIVEKVNVRYFKQFFLLAIDKSQMISESDKLADFHW